MVGHSLGGGLTLYLAAQHGYEGVAFSGVGVGFQIKGSQDLNSPKQPPLNILPNRDIVPLIDMQVGHLQTIRCPSPNSAVACHSLATTVGQLASSCGDPRYVPQGISGGFDMSALQQWLPISVCFVAVSLLVWAHKLSKANPDDLGPRAFIFQSIVNDWVYVDTETDEAVAGESNMYPEESNGFSEDTSLVAINAETS